MSGGEDFDQRVMDHFIKLFKKKKGKDIRKNNRSVQKLRREVEKAKRALSSAHQARIEIESFFEGEDFSETLTRAKFEELNMVGTVTFSFELKKKRVVNATAKKTQNLLFLKRWKSLKITCKYRNLPFNSLNISRPVFTLCHQYFCVIDQLRRIYAKDIRGLAGNSGTNT